MSQWRHAGPYDSDDDDWDEDDDDWGLDFAAQGLRARGPRTKYELGRALRAPDPATDGGDFDWIQLTPEVYTVRGSGVPGVDGTYHRCGLLFHRPCYCHKAYHSSPSHIEFQLEAIDAPL